MARKVTPVEKLMQAWALLSAGEKQTVLQILKAEIRGQQRAEQQVEKRLVGVPEDI